MDLEHDLSNRLHDHASSVSAHADLGEVVTGAARRRRRTRRLAIGGATAIVALGVGGVFVVADRDTAPVDRAPAAQPAAEGDGVPAAGDDVPAATGVDVPAATDAPSGTEVAPATEPAVIATEIVTGWDGPDPAEQYLDATTEVYRRTMPGGDEVAVRLGDTSYAETFGLEWTAPTGSTELCLGHPVALIGGVERAADWPSGWAARQWVPLASERDVEVEVIYLGGERAVALVRTRLPAIESALSGFELRADRTSFVDGVAVLELAYEPSVPGAEPDGDEQPFITLFDDAAAELLALPLYEPETLDGFDPACAPPPAPTSALPEPGPQPADPATDEADIRARHALLVDQSVSQEDKEGLLDDDTGVSEAREQMEAGQYAESAAGAQYTLEEFVFTDPDTAWFRYTIEAPTGTFANRFGQAVRIDGVWKITRQTICQDLSLALGRCDGEGTPTPTLSPIGEDEMEARWQEWQRESAAYWVMTCDPLVGC